ncbi:hypothetical protein [Actinokineospora fastidiosa]|uniref:Uncharacterized protein n=1 Tax=Actinokineospora fastidiosa TaxID=1816 RepID=A0A918GTG5_9PSEU|nr:hypothetical protein [Actinokineospora fastidiosa]GGS57577.1 hypothetical protein GCM10010171_60670 [Actinokineospora fastidiosa]
MRMARALVVAAVVVGGCGTPPTSPFSRIDLPPGLTPVVLAADGDSLLVGGQWADRPVVPGLLRLGADRRPVEVPLTPATPYGGLAEWTSLAADDGRILAIGGKRGGAHGNVRWSVWTGTAAGVAERKQAAGAFGSYGAGDLIGGALPDGGQVVIGTWENARTAMDVAAWTIDEAHTATRLPSAGTALESTAAEIVFPTGVSSTDRSVVVSGWQVDTASGAQTPVIWHSETGATGWTKTPLPDSGATAIADAVTCHPTCATTGRTDHTAAVWLRNGTTWTRLPDMPATPTTDQTPLPAPAWLDDRLLVAVPHETGIRLLSWRAGTWTTHETGLPGTPTALARAGDHLYLLTTDNETRTLWHTPTTTLTNDTEPR